MPSPAFEPHDHAACVAHGVAAAERHCAAHGLHFTRVRRRVLEILLHEHKAMGAYEILARLSADGMGSQPPVAYRALDFLVAHGFAHRIERRNAFVACTHQVDDRHDPAFLICRACDRVVEAGADPAAGELGRAARAAGFVIERAVREAEGLCPQCSAGAPA